VAQTPDELLTHLFDLNSKRVAKTLTEQAQDLDNPPMTVQEVLVELALHAPGFVDLISSTFPK